MKQGLNFNLAVNFDIDLDYVEKIEFVFKKINLKDAEAIKKCAYPEQCKRKDEENIILVPFTKEETFLFPSDKDIYMDTRITLKGTIDQPETNIVKLMLNKTLFNENGDV